MYEYVLMRSGGASMQTILSSVRKEGQTCVMVGMGLCAAAFIIVSFVMRLVFLKTVNANMLDFGSLIAVVIISLTIFVFSVVFTTKRAEKKIKNLDLVALLKDLAY